MTDEELVSCLEALLFASGKPVDINALTSIIDVSTDRINEAASKLQEKLENDSSGIQLIEIDKKIDEMNDEIAKEEKSENKNLIPNLNFNKEIK